MKIWSWRQAVQKSGLPSTTKLILLNLSVYMNDAGDCCYPSIRQQAEDTGLSARAVCEHLGRAVEAGFLEKSKHGFGGQSWARNEYQAALPEGVSLGKGVNPASTPSHEKAFTEDTHVAGKVCTQGQRGVYPDDKKVLTQGQTNSPENSPVISPTRARGEAVDKSGYRDGGKAARSAGEWRGVEGQLSDTAIATARRHAPGWDVYFLMRSFDASIAAGKLQPPEDANRAFPGWVKAFTRGRPPA